MSNTLKILGAVAAVGAVAATAYVVVKKQEEKKRDISESPETEEATEEKKETVVDRVKLAAQKKVIKIFAWIVLHKDKLEALGIVLSVIGGLFEVITAAKDYCTGAKLRKQITTICNDRMEFREAWNGTIDNYDKMFASMKNSIEHVEHMVSEL